MRPGTHDVATSKSCHRDKRDLRIRGTVYSIVGVTAEPLTTCADDPVKESQNGESGIRGQYTY